MTPPDLQATRFERQGEPPSGPPRRPEPSTGVPPSMWRVIADSIRDAVALARADRFVVLALLVLNIALSTLSILTGREGRHSDLPFLLAMVAQLASLPFTLRFCAQLLDIPGPKSLPPQTWPRLIGWCIFCVLLGQVEQVALLPLPLPSLISGALFAGAIYFQLRLLPLYPALLSWPEWRGIDRVWTPFGRFVVPLASCAAVIYIPLIVVVAVTLVVVTGGLSSHPDQALILARLHHVMRPVVPILSLVMALVNVATTLFGAALRVRLFRLIA